MKPTIQILAYRFTSELRVSSTKKSTMIKSKNLKISENHSSDNSGPNVLTTKNTTIYLTALEADICLLEVGTESRSHTDKVIKE